MRIILCGLPGVGKSVCGKKAAQMLGWSFVDVDKCLEVFYHKKTGEEKTYREIYEAYGEDNFRQWEQQTLKSLEVENHCIIALGGGALELFDNRKIVRELGRVIFLQGTAEMIWERKSHRFSKQSFLKLAQQRQQQYRDTCHIVVGVDGLNVDEVACLIVGEKNGQ